MTSTPRAGSYRALLSRPGVLPLVLSSSAGRLGYAMLPLLYLFTVRDAAASFTTAAAAMSALGVGALAMPAVARLIDRHGQRRLLPPLALTHGALVAALVVLAGVRLPAVTWLLLAGVTGMVSPPLGPAMRAQWRVICADDTDTAYALDATLEEVLWLLGPALSGVVLTVATARAGLVVVPVLIGVGAAGLASSRWRPRVTVAGPDGPHASALQHRELWPVLLTMLLAGGAGALAATGVAAVADHRGTRSLAAIGEVTLGIGAVMGGYLWGHHRLPWAPLRNAVTLAATWSAALGVLWLVDVSPASLVLLAVAGATSAPLWVLAFGAADRAVPETARTEASTWVTTASNLGSAAGTALTGVCLAVAGATGPLIVASATAACAALVTLVGWSSRP